MRHRVAGRKMGRTASHRKATRQALVVSLLRHESIITRPALAKEVRAMTERLITRAKKGGLANYRLALSRLGDKEVVKKLFNEIAPRYADREGGYTRILRLSERRLNDGAERCLFELVGSERRSDRRKASKKPKVVSRLDREAEAPAPNATAPAEEKAPESVPAAEPEAKAPADVHTDPET